MNKELKELSERLTLKEEIQKDPSNEKLKIEYLKKYGKKEYRFLLKSLFDIKKNRV